MARIPNAQPDVTLGGVVARPQQAVGQDVRAFGAGIAAESERLAGAGVAAAQAELARQEAEQRRQQAQDEAERRAREREARRVAAVTAQARVVNDLADLQDEIGRGLADGSIDKTSAGEIWQTRSAELLKAGLEGVDAEHRSLVEASLLDNVGRAQRDMRRLLAAKDRQDIAQGAAAHLEEMQRFAARGGAQADEAIRNVEAFIPSVAAQAGIDAQRTVQAFRERVRFRQAQDLVLGNPSEALRTLRNPETFPELDPDKRATLLAQADAAVLRAQERARIEAERIAREQDRVFAGAAAVFESGRAFSAEYADQVLAKLKGSPYEAGIRQMIEAGPQNVAAATMPIEQQRAQLDALLAQANAQGSSPAVEKEIGRRQKVLAAAERDARDDPLGAALERGVIQSIAPINPLDLGTLPAALAQRTAAAQAASTWAGRPVSPLRPAEAEQLAQAIKAMPVQQRAAIVNLIAQATPDGQSLRAMAGQIAGKDQALATAFVLAADGNKTTDGRSVTELYLRGAEVLATKQLKGESDKEMRAAATIRGNMAQAIGDAYFSPQARDLYVDAAVKIQAALKADGVGDSDERAVRLATGGVVTRNGRQVVKPYGWSDRDFDRWLDSTRQAIKAGGGEFIAGGARLSGEQLAAALPAARLAAVGAGQYVIVGPGGQIVRRPTGEPLVLDSAR